MLKTGKGETEEQIGLEIGRACIKIPQELVELHFLGFKFMGARFVLTTLLVIAVGMLIEGVSKQGRKAEKLDKEGCRHASI